MNRYLALALALSLFLAVAGIGNAEHGVKGDEEEHFHTPTGEIYYIDTDTSDEAVVWQESNGVSGLQTASSTNGDGETTPADTPIA